MRLPDEGTLAQNVAFYKEGNYLGWNVEQYDALIELFKRKWRNYAEEEIGYTLQEGEYEDLMHVIKKERAKTEQLLSNKKPFTIPPRLIPQGLAIDCEYERGGNHPHSVFNYAHTNEHLSSGRFARLKLMDGSRISFTMYDRQYYPSYESVDFETLRTVRYLHIHDSEIVTRGQGIHSKFLAVVDKIARANECDLIGETVPPGTPGLDNFMRNQGFKLNTRRYAYKILTPRGREYLQEINDSYKNDLVFELE